VVDVRSEDGDRRRRAPLMHLSHGFHGGNGRVARDNGGETRGTVRTRLRRMRRGHVASFASIGAPQRVGAGDRQNEESQHRREINTHAAKVSRQAAFESRGS